MAQGLGQFPIPVRFRHFWRNSVRATCSEHAKVEATIDLNHLAGREGKAPEAMAATALPTSAGSPQRRIGEIPAAIYSSYPACTDRVMSVSIRPGRTS